MGEWDAAAPGVLTLPSGRRIRGRGLRRPLPVGPTPDFTVHLLGRRPRPVEWESRWVFWPDLWLPKDRDDAAGAFREAWTRAGDERVEIACAGGRGRTGTALACIAVLDGVSADDAVAHIRAHYDPGAVEMPWQRRYICRFSAG